MAKCLMAFLVIPLVLTLAASRGVCQSDNSFPTKYSTIHYSDEKDFTDFIWKLGGSRTDLVRGTDIAASRVDRIVERVEAILDMTPANFRMDIFIKRGPVSPDRIAYYDTNARAIHISLENASEGVFAHEVAHAVIDQYFGAPPPSKTGEILTQYVDKYLWSDY